MFRQWLARSGYVSLLRSEEDSFGGQAFYKYYGPTGRKIGRRQTLWGSVNLDGYAQQKSPDDQHQ
jgi:hypothetical protein